VSEARDPLGKRALFWAPAERQEEAPFRSEHETVRGRHALYSVADAVQPPQAARPRGVLGGIVGPIVVECSSCRARTQVETFEFVMLHLPVWLWRPGKGFTRLMVCPSCRRRTWTSVSFPAWSR
jgi:hypothetical protein